MCIRNGLIGGLGPLIWASVASAANPVITSISPTTGAAGAALTLNGNYLYAAGLEVTAVGLTPATEPL